MEVEFVDICSTPHKFSQRSRLVVSRLVHFCLPSPTRLLSQATKDPEYNSNQQFMTVTQPLQSHFLFVYGESWIRETLQCILILSK